MEERHKGSFTFGCIERRAARGRTFAFQGFLETGEITLLDSRRHDFVQLCSWILRSRHCDLSSHRWSIVLPNCIA